MAWRRCSKCGGPMSYESDEWAWACLYCGKRRYVGGILEAQEAREAREGRHEVSEAPLPAYVDPARLLREERAAEIKASYALGGTQRALAERYGVHQRTIARILASAERVGGQEVDHGRH